MSKAYTHVRTDLADAAAVATFVTANPSHYSLGATIVSADGARSVVLSAGTVGIVTVV